MKLFAPDMRVPFSTSDLPAYAMALLQDAEGAERSRTDAPRRFGELPVRRVGVYDLRGEEGMPDLE
jgi:hypothetical protein